MKRKHWMWTVVLVLLVGGTSVGANETLQTWKGKKVRIEVNDELVTGGGIQVEGKTYVPIRTLNNTFQALIHTENATDTINIYKPNVHLFLFSGDKNAMRPFGNVYTGKYEFFVFAQVDNLLPAVHSIRTTVSDPNGVVVETQTVKMADTTKDNFWYTTSPIKLDFKLTGSYLVRFAIKQTEEGEYETLSQKSITSMKRE